MHAGAITLNFSHPKVFTRLCQSPGLHEDTFNEPVTVTQVCQTEGLGEGKSCLRTSEKILPHGLSFKPSLAAKNERHAVQAYALLYSTFNNIKKKVEGLYYSTCNQRTHPAWRS